MSLLHWMQLSLTRGIGPVLIGRLVEMAGSAESACGMKAADLRNVEGIGTAKASAIAEALRHAADEATRQLEAADRFGAKVLTRESPEYPEMLKSIYDPPVVLYCQGAPEARDLLALAIVGSRRCSVYGREQAERFGSLVAGAGLTVISGGARGVDSCAHRGALRHPAGRTIAVIGSGLDVPYPAENAGLFQQIAGRGVVLTEYPFGTPPNAENFPRRNRIISGMARGVLVVEADQRSGALITARVAAEDHARTVFALPGRVDNALSSGPHQLIRDGAILTTCLEDILSELGPLPDSVAELSAGPGPAGLFEDPAGEAPRAPAALNLTPVQSTILGAMDHGTVSIDQLVEATQLDAATLLRELTFLTLKGRIKRMDGQTFQRR